MFSGNSLSVEGGAFTATRLRLKAQGCFNPGKEVLRILKPGTGCGRRRNRLAVDVTIPVTQGSRKRQPWAPRRNRFAAKIFRNRW